MRLERRLPTVALVAAGLLAAGAALPGAAAADIRPGSLPRGADLTRPYVEGTTIVDGSRLVDLPMKRPALVAKVRGGYVVRGGSTGTFFVDRAGEARRLPGASEDVVLSPDGRTYTTAGLASDGETVVGVRRVSDGSLLASHTFRSWVDKNIGRFAHPIDLVGDRVLVGGDGGRVLVWDWRRNTFRDVIGDKWHLEVGSLRDDIAAGWTAPGERCTFVARLSAPHRRVWKSCDERVVAFSPDGRRMLTTDRRVEPAFGRIRFLVLRTLTGRVLARWRAERFTDVVLESGRAVSFRVEGRTSSAMVRCTPTRCRAASDPVPLD